MIKALFLSLRPKTLTAAIVPIAVGSALVVAMGEEFLWWVSFYALLASLFIQMATNLFNDVIDFKKGADSQSRIGPTRVTQKGLVPEKWVWFFAIFFLALALGVGVILVMRGGWPIFWIGLISLFLAYAYTGGPYPLAYKGLGDLFVFLFFGLIAVTGLVYLHTLSWPREAFIAGAQVGLLSTILIVVNNMRDAEEDKKVGKMTLAARFGLGFSRMEVLTLTVSAYLLLFYWLSESHTWAFFLPLVVLPMSVRLLLNLWRHPPSSIYNEFLARAAFQHLLFGISLSIGFLVTS